MADERDAAAAEEKPAGEAEVIEPAAPAPEAAAGAPEAAAAPEGAAAPPAPSAPAAPSAPPARRPGPPRRGGDRDGGRGRRPSSGPAPARVYIKSTFNNIIISITDQRGNVIAWASGGSIGFVGTKKGTPFAAQLAADSVGRKALDAGINRVDAYCKGPGSARETALRTLQGVGVDVAEIKDVTPTPHNGCRPKKRRRM